MRKLLLTVIFALSAIIAFGQTEIKVEAPNVVAADEQFNVTFIIEGEKNPSDFQWSSGSDFQVLWGYGDRLEVNGLNLLSAPGNDLVASTALAAAGCHIVLFTTGRGTPFGTFVPTMKVATNPTLAQRKATWIDFNAGQLIEGKDMLTVRNEFIDKVLSVASGEPAQNEKNGYREISIFKNGVTL